VVGNWLQFGALTPAALVLLIRFNYRQRAQVKPSQVSDKSLAVKVLSYRAALVEDSH